MPITNLTEEDFVNGAKEKVNNAFGEIPVSFVPTPDGNLIITKFSGEKITVPLKNFFALLSTVFESIRVGMATPEEAGKVFLVDEDIPAHFESANRVLTAVQVMDAIEDAIKGVTSKSLSELISGATKPERNAAFKALMESVDASDATQAIFCQLASRCVSVIKPVYNFTNSVYYEAKPVTVLPLQPNYVGRFDENNCEWFRGWFVDTNHPNVSPTVRIVRDGVVIANIVCSIDRTDVRNVLTGDGRLPQGTTYNLYGWSYTKTSADNDGKEHTFDAFGGTSSTKATTDTGASAKWTCGTTVVNPPIDNPPPVNNPPRIAGIYNDQVVGVAGDYLLDSFAGLFADDDALTYRVTMGDGKPLDAGIVFTPGDAKPIKVQAGYPNQQRPMTIHARDTAGNETPKSFLLTVARPVIQVDPVTVKSRAFGGDIETIEGNGARVKIVQTMSNDAQSDYTGGGTYRIIPNYPDGMTITTDRNAVGVIATKETITADVPVTLEFASTEGWTVTGPFTVRNKTVATSPIVSQLINDIRVIEGSGGTVQVYDVHADGNWTEVTSANGSKFELVAPYPNGMYLTFSATGRAQVQTAGNSISEDVPVKVRYTPATGPVVEGIITVVNQPPPTTENPTPDQSPYIEKFALRITQQASDKYIIQLLVKVVNLPVGTAMEFNYPEFYSRQGLQQAFPSSPIKSDSSEFPSGYKDYNAFYGLYHMPVTLVQSHSVQHIKVRKAGSGEFLLDTTFDPYGMAVGQTKQFYPL